MTTLQQVLSSECVHRWGWTLLHSLWQLAIIGMLAALLLGFLRRRSPNLRYVVACVGLAAMFFSPLATYCLMPSAADPTLVLASTPTTASPLPTEPLADMAIAARNDRPVVDTALPKPSPADSETSRSSRLLDLATRLFAPCVPWTVLIWLIGVLGLATWHVGGFVAAGRLRCVGIMPVPESLARSFHDLKTRLRVTQPVRLVQSILVEVPVAIGWLRPVILLPVGMLTGLAPHEIEAVLAHELAHVRRYDYLVNLLQTVVETLLFYHPAVWWVSRRIRIERENCCDDTAVVACGSKVDYVTALTTIEKNRTAPKWAMAATGAKKAGATLSRVRRILGVSAPSRSQASVWVGGLIVLALVGGLAVIIPFALAAPSAKSETENKTSEIAAPPAAAANPPEGRQPANDSSSRGEQPKIPEPDATKANGEPSETSAEKPPEALTYTGKVTDKLTGKPIAGATVTVRRQIVAPYEHRIIEEPTYTTDAAGKYTFTIPPEQVADRYMYIELDVSHPDYATRKGFGYALSMIRKNEKLGDPPFFEHVELYPADAITGTVVTSDGKPAAAVKVLGFTMPDREDFDSASFTDTTTDPQGAFRLNLSKGSDAVFWLVPKDYAPSTHVIDRNRGDQGRFVLEKGIELKGRVVDENEKPVSGVWVNAEIIGGRSKKPISLPVADCLARAALTDNQGQFGLGPLPEGECLVRVAEYPHDSLLGRQTVRKPPAVFGPKKLTLKEGETPGPVVIRGVPQVVIEGQYYDSRGKPRSGHEPDLWGRLADKALGDQGVFFSTQGDVDRNGHFVIRAPKGLTEARLNVITNEHTR